jgi:glutamate dehydrogenase/leucine dehydrogenase
MCPQISMGQGIFAKTAEVIVDAAVKTPTAMNWFVAQSLEVALPMAQERNIDKDALQQVRQMRCN